MEKVESISLDIKPEVTPAILVKTGYHGLRPEHFRTYSKDRPRQPLPYGRSFLNFSSPLLLNLLQFSVCNFLLYITSLRFLWPRRFPMQRHGIGSGSHRNRLQLHRVPLRRIPNAHLGPLPYCRT